MSNTEMTTAAKEARREYMKNWKREHPDRVKAHQANYWNKRAQQDQSNAAQ